MTSIIVYTAMVWTSSYTNYSTCILSHSYNANLRLPLINIAPVTEWMEQERARAEHEAKKAAHAAAQAQHQQQLHTHAPPGPPPRASIPRNQMIMKSQNDANVVSKYKVIKKH